MTTSWGCIAILHLLCSPRVGGSLRALFLLHTGTQVGCFKTSATAQDLSTADKFPAKVTKNEVYLPWVPQKEAQYLFTTVIPPEGLNI